MPKVECLIEKRDDPNRNESVLYVLNKGKWTKQKSFIANGKLMGIFLEIGCRVKISSCGIEDFYIVTRSGLKKVRKENVR